MLLQFSVENYKSFKDQAVLSLEASTDKELERNLTVVGKNRILNSAAVFGANAAGKSNLFLAITAAVMLIRQSNSRQINEPLERIVPYRFDPECAVKPTSFEFVFIAEGKKYVYGFSATVKAVITEYLYVYNTAKASTIFERTEGNKYKFTSLAVKRELLPITERNTDNKLFLATATAWNCKNTRIPYLWFGEKINTYSNNSENLLPLVAPMFANNDDNSLRIFTNRILREADVSIDDYMFETSDAPKEAIMQAVPPELQNIVSTLPGNGKLVRIEAIHTIEKQGKTSQFKMPLKDESKGTRNLFMFSPILKKAFDTGETLCVDEFDASLHPLLVIYLLKLFHNPEVNKAHAQLVVSAHAMELLSLEHLRRDQIYFVEKKRKTGESELYSLDEFSPRKEENIRRAYLFGRYGAIPDIPEEAKL